MKGRLPQRPITPDSEFLTDVLAQLQRRSKSRKHKNISLELDRVVEVFDDCSRERIDLKFVYGLRHPTIRFEVSLWENRDLWLQACEPELGSHGGWKYSIEDSGRLVSDVDSRVLVGLFEESISKLSGMTQANAARLTSLWQPHLAKGPSAI